MSVLKGERLQERRATAWIISSGIQSETGERMPLTEGTFNPGPDDGCAIAAPPSVEEYRSAR